MAKTTDPRRARLLELTQQLSERSAQLRDYASVPGNAWLAKGELEGIAYLTGELEALLEDIRQADAEEGY